MGAADRASVADLRRANTSRKASSSSRASSISVLVALFSRTRWRRYSRSTCIGERKLRHHPNVASFGFDNHVLYDVVTKMKLRRSDPEREAVGVRSAVFFAVARQPENVVRAIDSASVSLSSRAETGCSVMRGPCTQCGHRDGKPSFLHRPNPREIVRTSGMVPAKNR